METPSSATHGNCGGSCGWVPVGGNGLCLRGHSKGRWSGGSLRRCLAPVGQGALLGCVFDAVCPAGKGAAEWRAVFWRIAEKTGFRCVLPIRKLSRRAGGRSCGIRLIAPLFAANIRGGAAVETNFSSFTTFSRPQNPNFPPFPPQPHPPHHPASPNAAGRRPLRVGRPPCMCFAAGTETKRSTQAPCSWGLGA